MTTDPDALRVGARAPAGRCGRRDFCAESGSTSCWKPREQLFRWTSLQCRQGVAPSLGLGTYKLVDESIVTHALRLGYQVVDCARVYDNEALVGRALQSAKREELVIVTKVWPTHLARGLPTKSVRASLEALQLSHVDLLLVHWPIVLAHSESERLPEDDLGNVRFDLDTSLEDVWREFLEIKDSGLATHVGVSNFNSEQLTKLEESQRRRPHVNQVEAHPLLNNARLISFCHERDIAVMAYCPLARGKALQLDVVTRLAAKHRKSPAQVCLRWAVQRGTLVIPKASSVERLQENASLWDFELSAADMEAIDACDRQQRISSLEKTRASPLWPFRADF